LSAQVRLHNSGRSGAWITFIGYPGETPIVDGELVQFPPADQEGLINGAFQIEGVSYIRIVNLTIVNSHQAGFTIRNSSNVDLINNSTNGTFSSGIAVWDTKHKGEATQHIRIIGNTIKRATTWDLASADVPRRGEAPHEALSVGGAVNFEVAYNHVYDSDKEGIDIKETSKTGKVHHNLVDHVERQGIYVDAWFGSITQVEVYSNVVHDCAGAGLALSAENGQFVADVNIYNNLIFNNKGSGLLFSRWGINNPRRHIRIANNVFYHNGYGPPTEGQAYYWITGGLYLYSTNIDDILIRDNIFSDNRGFQIGYSELFLKEFRSWRVASNDKNIQIADNVIDGHNTVNSPIESGGLPVDQVKIYAVSGKRPVFANPMFKDPANQDFGLRHGSPAITNRIVIGSYLPGSSYKTWWTRDFPPKLFRSYFR
jgi:hypothetical protein